MKKTLVLFLNFLMLALLLAGCNKPSGEEEKTGGDEKKTVVTGVYTFEPIDIGGSKYGRNGSITLYDDGTWKYSGESIREDSAPEFIETWCMGTYTVSGSEITLHCKATCNDGHNEYNDGVTYYEVFSISNEGDVSTWTYITTVYKDVYNEDCESFFNLFLFNGPTVLTISTYESMTEEQKLSCRYKMTFKRNEL